VVGATSKDVVGFFVPKLGVFEPQFRIIRNGWRTENYCENHIDSILKLADMFQARFKEKERKPMYMCKDEICSELVAADKSKCPKH